MKPHDFVHHMYTQAGSVSYGLVWNYHGRVDWYGMFWYAKVWYSTYEGEGGMSHQGPDGGSVVRVVWPGGGGSSQFVAFQKKVLN